MSLVNKISNIAWQSVCSLDSNGNVYHIYTNNRGKEGIWFFCLNHLVVITWFSHIGAISSRLYAILFTCIFSVFSFHWTNKKPLWKLFPSLFFTDHQDPTERLRLWTFPVLQSVSLRPSLCAVWLVPWQMCAIGGMPHWNMDSGDLSAYNLWGRNLSAVTCAFDKHKSH